MSKQSRDKNDKAKDHKEPLKQSEKRPEEALQKKPQVKVSRLKKATPKKKQQIIMTVMIILAAVMVIATALVLLHNRWFKKPDLPPTPTQSNSGSIPSAVVPSGNPGSGQGPGPTPGTVTVEPLAGGERKSKNFFTILIFGMDNNSGLTDTIMVASYDVTNQKATVLSIPRDTLINNRYLDKSNKSINATYKQNNKGEKGAEALKTEVSRLIGFVPDFYVTINWELVGKMVDAVDGVEFDVPWRMKYDDPYQNLHIDLKAGLQTLDGEHAMQLVRWRKNNPGIRGGGDSSDLSRLNVQHNFLKAVLKQTLQPQNIIRVPELIRLFNENVVSDLAVENMLWFGEQAVLGGLGVDDVEFVTMPVYGTENTHARYYGKVCAIKDQLLKIINSSLNPYVEDVTMQQLDLIQMSTDGNILSSTTGTLRNPASGVFEYPDDPIESDPAESDPTESDPVESGEPWESDPVESGEPWESDPVESGEPWESDPVESGESWESVDPDPGQTDSPPSESEPAAEPYLPDGDEPDDGDWGYTPD